MTTNSNSPPGGTLVLGSILGNHTAAGPQPMLGNTHVITTNNTAIPGLVNSGGHTISIGNQTDHITLAGMPLTQFMRTVEERLKTVENRLLILVPDEALLAKYEALKEAYEHYKLMEKLLTENT